MIDVHEVLRELLSEDGICGNHIWHRKRRWVCARPEGHDGSCARVDLTLRYFDPETLEVGGSVKYGSHREAEGQDDA